MHEHEDVLSYGGFLKIRRLLAGLTLRRAAEASGISHTYLQKVEKDEVEVSRAIAERVHRTLDIEADAPKHDPPTLRANTRKVCERIVYPDPRLCRETYAELMKDAPRYLQSVHALEFMLLMIGCGASLATMDEKRETTTRFIRILSKMSAHLSAFQQLHFHLFKGIIEYHRGYPDDAIDDLMTVMEDDLDHKHLSLASYYLGRAQSDKMCLVTAQRHFSFCLQECRKSANYALLAQASLYDVLNALRRGEVATAEKTWNGIEETIRFHDIEIRNPLILRIPSLFDIFRGRPKQALNTLKNTKGVEDLGDMFLMAWAAYLLDDRDTVEACAEATADLDETDASVDTLNRKGIEAFVASFHDDAQKKENAFSSFYKNAVQRQAPIEIRLAHRLYHDWLESRRKYKTMHRMNMDMIAITKTMMK